MSITAFKPIDMNTARLNRLEGSLPRIKASLPIFSRGKFRTPTSVSVINGGPINPVSGVQGKGNISPFTMQGNVGFSATTTSITIYWDGTNGSTPLVVKRGDGTNFSIPAGHQVVSGLTASTRYGFSIYWRVDTATRLSFGAGDSGSPELAVSPSASDAVVQAALQAQQQTNAEAVYSGLIYATTPASGSSSPTGQTKSGATFATTRVRGFSTQ